MNFIVDTRITTQRLCGNPNPPSERITRKILNGHQPSLSAISDLMEDILFEFDWHIPFESWHKAKLAVQKTLWNYRTTPNCCHCKHLIKCLDNGMHLKDFECFDCSIYCEIGERLLPEYAVLFQILTEREYIDAVKALSSFAVQLPSRIAIN